MQTFSFNFKKWLFFNNFTQFYLEIITLEHISNIYNNNLNYIYLKQVFFLNWKLYKIFLKIFVFYLYKFKIFS